MFIFKLVVLLVVAIAIICMLISPVMETLKVTSEEHVRSDKQLSLSGTPYVLKTPVRLYLRLNFMLERSIPKSFQLMSTKSTDGHKIKFKIRKLTLVMKPSWPIGSRHPKGVTPLGLIRTDKLNNLSVRISDPYLIIKLNNNRAGKVRLSFNFTSSQVTFGKSKHTYSSPVCTITSFFIRNKLQDLTKAKKVEKS